uniref:Uncharacterized protein n=1 Tax=Chrysotila carterae TaxID=13221 RepID=A0A7S4BQW5_CHRCT
MPRRRYANGSYEIVTDATFKTRGRGVARGAWGWDQACYHMYLMEQHHGLLPRHCPRFKLDFNGAITLPLAKARRCHRRCLPKPPTYPTYKNKEEALLCATSISRCPLQPPNLVSVPYSCSRQRIANCCVGGCVFFSLIMLASQ